MAINYLNNVFESTANTDPNTLTFGSAVAANSLVIVALCAARSGTNPGVVSVTDSQGNTYTKTTTALLNKMVGLAYCRTPAPLSTSDTLTVDWNGALTDSWVSGHSFSNALGTAYDTSSNAHAPYGSGTTTTPQVTVDVTGSDWLSFGVFYFYNVSLPTVTPVNSSLSRDSTTSAGAECFSRNGTTGSTHTIGGTLASGAAWIGTAASFLVDPSGGGTGNRRYQPTLVGV